MTDTSPNAHSRSLASVPVQGHGLPPDVVTAFLARPLIPTATGCQLWPGATTSKGYPNLAVSGVTYGAHRVSFQIHKGQIPAGHMVRHACHMPECCNPDHLLTGTVKDNCRDSVKAGRGSRVSIVKRLTVEQVRKIKRLRSQGYSAIDVSRAVGISPNSITRIDRRELFASIEGPAPMQARQRWRGKPYAYAPRPPKPAKGEGVARLATDQPHGSDGRPAASLATAKPEAG